MLLAFWVEQVLGHGFSFVLDVEVVDMHVVRFNSMSEPTCARKHFDEQFSAFSAFRGLCLRFTILPHGSSYCIGIDLGNVVGYCLFDCQHWRVVVVFQDDASPVWTDEDSLLVLMTPIEVVAVIQNQPSN